MAAGQQPVDGGAQLRLIADAVPFCLMLDVALELCGKNLTKVIYKKQGAMLDDVFSHIAGKPTDDAWVLAQKVIAEVFEKYYDTSGVLNETSLLDQAKLVYDLKNDFEDLFELQLGANFVKSILLEELYLKPLGKTGKTLLEYGISAHVAELTLAWMELMSDETSYVEPRYRQLHVNCPVDIKVFDSDGKLVAQFIDDVPQEIEGSTIIAYLDNDGQKCDPTAPDSRITFHGLRHTYAAEKYKSLINGGMTPLDAHFTVSRLLGHERPDVTDIYLASVKGGMSRGE